MLATRVPGAALVAACSPDAPERAWATRELSVASVYATYAELLAHAGLDAVVLATPTTSHAAQIMQALGAGKHVFSEKPTSLDLAECLAVEKAAAEHPELKVLIGYVRRFDASYRDAFEKVSSGAIGAPFLVRSHTLDKNDPSGFFVRFAPTSGGIFLDMSVHDIDAARWFLGGPRAVRVFAIGTVAVHDGLKACNDLDNAMALCEFEGGKMACFQASRTMAHGHESMTEVVGTQGRISIGANPSLTRVAIADAHGVRNECTPTFYERFEGAFNAELNAFVAAVLDGAPLPLNLKDATEATRIGIAIQESVRTRAAVELRPDAAVR
ncbi:MAG: Gfo/Idh/MocA family oxidoreductase [Pseudomonadota bacterium]|nr:Gfo/Idh/MocA family oxidoreductase [Pseudomonadota bacterium]